MTYRLVLVSHGPAGQLRRVLGAFAQYVRPAPTELLAVLDGHDAAVPPADELGPWQVHVAERAGFCATTQRAWAMCAKPGPDFVFYLENDFVITRSVELKEVARVLSVFPEMAQMALMRDAVNEQEKEAGGLYESLRDDYTCVGAYLEHQAYFTTNPSLMRRDFMSRWPWPVGSECEGKFGSELVKAGYTFGVWGTGEPWCKHIGERDGFGY